MPRIQPPRRFPSALEAFTGRQDLIEAFDRLLAGKDPRDNDVLVFHGEGGIGKTTLSRKLEQDLGSTRLHGRLDFANTGNTEPDIALYRLRHEFPKLAFPTFSIAVAYYAKRFHPDAALLADRGAFLEGAGPFADLLEVALDAPGVSVPLKALKAALHGTKLLKEWYTRRAEPLLRDLAVLSQEEFRERLPQLWARDMRDALLRLGGHAEYDDDDVPAVAAPVGFLDSYEALWRPGLTREGVIRRIREDWLVDLVSLLPEVVWVISGRDKLAWAESHDAGWDECLRQHLVGQLSDDDARAFLAKRGVDDPAIVDEVVGAAAGLPFYLELQAQLHDRTPPERRSPAAFGGSLAEVIERLLGYLGPSEKDTMRVLSTLDSWDVALFSAMVTEFGTGYSSAGAEEFGALWSVDDIAPGRWKMHAEMATQLQRELFARDPGRFTSLHAFALQYLDAKEVGGGVWAFEAGAAECLAGILKHGREALPPEELSIRFRSRASALSEAGFGTEVLSASAEYLDYADEVWGPDSQEVAGMLVFFGVELRDAGVMDEAEKVLRRALSIREASLDTTDRDLIIALDCLAALLAQEARFDEAVVLNERALGICEAVLPPDDCGLSGPLNTRATLMERLARFTEAESAYRRALAIDEAVDGPEAPSVATALNNLAVLLDRLGKPQAAEQYLRRALLIDQQALGPDSPRLVMTLVNLAHVLRDSFRLKEASELLARATAITDTALGPEHPMAAYVAVLAGHVSADNGDFEEAEKQYRRAIDVEEAAYGPAHPDVATIRVSLASLLERLGRVDEAEAILRNSVETLEAALGPSHEVVGAALNHLGLLLHGASRVAEAESILRRSLDVLEANYGVDSHRVAQAAMSLALALDELDRNEEAATEYARAIDILRARLAPDDAHLLLVEARYAWLLIRMHRGEEASPMFTRVSELLPNLLADDNAHPVTVNVATLIAQMLQFVGRDDLAAHILTQALRVSIATHGMDHLETASVASQLARSLAAIGDSRKAEMLLRVAYRNAADRLGEQHPRTQEARMALTEFLETRDGGDDADREDQLDSD